ncbi:MAG: type II toxin-antitoxin system VapB family antitoxin [Bacillota bacterium]
MRTTIEIPDDLRGKLLEIAARRGLKGYSEVVVEALRRYLEEESLREERKRRILALCGAWSDEQAEHALRVARELRERWTLSRTHPS